MFITLIVISVGVSVNSTVTARMIADNCVEIPVQIEHIEYDELIATAVTNSLINAGIDIRVPQITVPPRVTGFSIKSQGNRVIGLFILISPIILLFAILYAIYAKRRTAI